MTVTEDRLSPNRAEQSNRGLIAKRGLGHGRGGREPGLIGLVYVSPAFLLYFLLVLAPFAYAIFLSFFNWGGAGPLTFAGFANYDDIAREPDIFGSLLHASVLIIFWAVLPILIALLLVALMSRKRVVGLTVFRTVLFLPQVIPLVAIAAMWEWILGPSGPINGALQATGLGQLAQSWLGSFTWALPAVGIIGSWIAYGFAMVLFMAGVEKIPLSLYDAARVDGAGAFREFLTVTLPGLRSEITVVAVLTVTGAMTTFDIIYVLTAGGPGTSTVVPAYELYTLGFNDFRVGTASALGVVMSLLVFAIAFVIARFGGQREER